MNSGFMRDSAQSQGLAEPGVEKFSGGYQPGRPPACDGTRARCGRENFEYQGFDRQDEIKSLGLKVGYRFRRWLTLGAEYTRTRRDSNRPEFEYDKNLYLLTDGTISAWEGAQKEAIRKAGPDLAKQYRVTHYNMTQDRQQWNQAALDVRPTLNQ